METNDHDLLIRVDEKLELLLKQTDTIHRDFELRIRRLELWGAISIGFMYAVQAAIFFYLNFIKK